MKTTLFKILVVLLFASGIASAQEKYGKTFNAGVGLSYYGYIGHAVPAIMLNYEIDLVKNVTLAPFIGFYSYRNTYFYNGYYHRNKHGYYYDPYNRYYYRQTVVPIGVKGSYYFDDLFNAGDKWDFYAALSLGFAIRTIRYEDSFANDFDNRYEYGRRSGLYADLHFGTEYHVNQTIGLFADASIGMLQIGLALHHK